MAKKPTETHRPDGAFGFLAGAPWWALALASALWGGVVFALCLTLLSTSGVGVRILVTLALGLPCYVLLWELGTRQIKALEAASGGGRTWRGAGKLLPESQLATMPDRAPKGNDPRLGDGPVEGPPEEEFWDQYNRRLEFPLGVVGSVFLHILVFAAVIYVTMVLMNMDEDRSSPPMLSMEVGGLDDTGAGSMGSGGQENPDLERNVDPFKAAKDVLGTPQALADAKESIKQIALEDPTGNLPISAPNAAAYSQLDETVRKKLLGVGAPKGKGKFAGTGADGTPGAGPGGTGADSTRARGLRWVLRFKIVGGRDYIAQLKAMGAEVLIPIPPEGKQCLIIRDLDNPAPAIASDEDMRRIAGKIQFSDSRPTLVREVLEVLGVNPPNAKAFWAFFPKNVEEELSRKEKNYRNRRAEDIEETVFRVTTRGNEFELVVDDQVVKR